MATQLQRELARLLALADENGLSQAFDFVLPLMLKNTPQINEAVNTLHPTGLVDAVRSVLFPTGYTFPHKIDAIKLHRTLTGVGLKDSKDWVEKTFSV